MLQVINRKVEEVLLNETVDVIISEWMGFYLLHESMLPSVISARDLFLAPGGILLPSHARIFAAPASMEAIWASRVGFWANTTATYNLNLRYVEAFFAHAQG